jgi:hypothetical protein
MSTASSAVPWRRMLITHWKAHSILPSDVGSQGGKGRSLRNVKARLRGQSPSLQQTGCYKWGCRGRVECLAPSDHWYKGVLHPPASSLWRSLLFDDLPWLFAKHLYCPPVLSLYSAKLHYVTVRCFV